MPAYPSLQPEDWLVFAYEIRTDDPPSPAEAHTLALGAQLNFTSHDMVVNRQGMLSEQQVMRLVGQIKVQALVGLVVPWLIALLIVAMALGVADSSLRLILAMAAALPGAIGAWWGFVHYAAAARLGDLPVHSAALFLDGRDWHPDRPGGLSFITSQEGLTLASGVDLSTLLVPGQMYQAYYVALPRVPDRRIVSLEPVQFWILDDPARAAMFAAEVTQPIPIRVRKKKKKK